MNILVVNGYTRQNKGDAALLSVLCEQLQKTFPDASIAISSQEDPQADPSFEAWPNIGSLIQYCFLDQQTGKATRLYRLVISICAIQGLMAVSKKNRRTIVSRLPQALRLQFESLIQADLVVSMGGGYLNGGASLQARGHWAIYREKMMANVCLYFMLAPLRLGKHLGACVVCAPQSMGPFVTVFQRSIVVKTLEKVNLILTREKKTSRLLAELSKRFPTVQSVDSAFLFNASTTTDLRSQLKVQPDQLLIGVTVRRWLNPSRQETYELAVAKAVDYLASQRKAVVVFIPQVTSPLGGDDDRITNKKVYANVKHKANIHLLTEDYTHQQIKSLYNELDLLIGTRFHSVIFSLTSLVPALAIEYEHKTSGIMHDLGLEKWVVKIEETTAEVLTAKINELIMAKRAYRRHLKRVLPAYVAEAQQAITLTKQVYEAAALSEDKVEHSNVV